MMTGQMMGGHLNSFGGWGMGFGSLFMVVFWGLVIWLIVAGVMRFSNQQRASQSESSLDILKMRYARSEISEEEFSKMKKTLE